MKNDHKSCPSAPMKAGTVLLGIVNQDDEIDFVSNITKINEAFVQSAKAGISPEKRFRFAGPCVQSGCKQWTGTRCGVIDRVLNSLEEKYIKAHLPSCAIRENCRWFAQSGAKACGVCPAVITDVT